METKRVAVIGGGLSGLATGYTLSRDGSVEVDVFESSDRVGGIVTTEKQSGFLYELGPQSMQSKHDKVEDLILDLGLDPRRVYRTSKKLKTFVVRDGKTVLFIPSLGGFLSTHLVSARAKLQLLLEPFRGRVREPDVSIADFAARRFGQEVADYMVDPMLSGVNGGNLKLLSTKYSLAPAWNAEQRSGSVLVGAFTGGKSSGKYPRKVLRTTYSFLGGLEELPKAMASHLHVEKKRTVKKICLAKDGKWDIGQGRRYDAVVSTVPTPALAHIQTCGNAPLRTLFENTSKLAYSAISILFLAFKRKDVLHPLDGFGCLLPTKEHRKLLGVVFTTSGFPNRSPKDEVGVNVFLGGGSTPELASLKLDDAVDVATQELDELFGVRGKPVARAYRQWRPAIPQYEVRVYEQHLKDLKQAEEDFGGLFFAGNYRDGVGVPDALNSGIMAAGRVLNRLHRSREDPQT